MIKREKKKRPMNVVLKLTPWSHLVSYQTDEATWLSEKTLSLDAINELHDIQDSWKQ